VAAAGSPARATRTDPGPGSRVVLRGPRPGAGIGALIVGVRGTGGRELVTAGLLLVGAALRVVVHVVGRTVAAVSPVSVTVLRGALGLLVALLRLGGRRRRSRGLADRVVDGDRDTDRAAALAAQGFADDRRQAPFQDTLRELVGHREQRGVRYECQRLAALDPVLVLRLDTLPTPLTEKLLQYSWPHCGKIGRYVSHRARSLTGPTNV
jgi:hypothetical protein